MLDIENPCVELTVDPAFSARDENNATQVLAMESSGNRGIFVNEFNEIHKF